VWGARETEGAEPPETEAGGAPETMRHTNEFDSS
jgi:hypothetical protein